MKVEFYMWPSQFVSLNSFLYFFWLAIYSYQMNPANYREALIEAGEDEAEGADILLVGIALVKKNWDGY